MTVLTAVVAAQSFLPLFPPPSSLVLLILPTVCRTCCACGDTERVNEGRCPSGKKKVLRGLSRRDPPGSAPSLWPAVTGQRWLFRSPFCSTGPKRCEDTSVVCVAAPGDPQRNRRRASQFSEAKVLANSQYCHRIRLPALGPSKLNT